MDTTRFENLAHSLNRRTPRRAALGGLGGRSRRNALATLAAGTAGGLAAGELLPTAAKKGKNSKKKKKKKTSSLPKVHFVEVSQPILGPGFVSVTAPCPDGTVPVGGGAFMDGQVEFALVASTTFPTAPPAWVGAAQITGDPQEGTEFTVVAVCMEAEVI